LVNITAIVLNRLFISLHTGVVSGLQFLEFFPGPVMAVKVQYGEESGYDAYECQPEGLSFPVGG
jgi:hypothetical protein